MTQLLIKTDSLTVQIVGTIFCLSIFAAVLFGAFVGQKRTEMTIPYCQPTKQICQ